MARFGAVGSGVGTYPRYAALAAAILAGLAAIGIPATLRLAGERGLAALALACAVSLVASLAGSVPVHAARGRGFPAAMPAVMGSIALRLAAVLFLGLAAALSGLVATAPFLVWLGVSHAGLLVADTAFALGATRPAPGSGSKEERR